MIAFLFAFAVGSFVLSLPVAKTSIGERLRQLAAVSFILALLPSVLSGLFFNSPVSGHALAEPPSFVERVTRGLSCLGALVVLSVLSYAILEVRRRLSKPKKDPWETLFSHRGGKRRVDPSDPADTEPFGRDPRW